MTERTMRLLLNCDMGESFGAWRMGDDVHAMPLIDQANLACGYHAGDPLTMQRTVRLAVEQGVSIGAHPAYPDLAGFGRRHMNCSPEEVQALVLYQVGALDAFCRAAGTRVDYVKPHGALYNDLVRDDALLSAVLEACAAYRKGLPLMVLALADNGRELQLADAADVPLIFEAFADRAYLPDGQLAPRRLPNAVHQEPQRILDQALAIARGEAFADIDGNPLRLRADSLCVHGDNPESLAVLRRLRGLLDQA
ncbi:LamB/YcsF family protein [Pseudomonas sp. ZM23]|uniref:5-oxoprolinase subunit A n=1 Tax=Pseudomonas triclosanedens TaxID=2961893 RepID=A0ABY7A3F8_9PSED|nr:5-oxoprolinase subunit PxpA [Pseudomonas triclosanedens]MCP8463803.1 LamB/YcsF family protein [Pseudomonas triclosanedens]MCP8468887.1 LamB/YcsF family protein [Pseudomonas triclosanedens]MCP8475609.1 LamB/YcsF family protein [Pseudomonas triclosanedens]WAI50673.1 LamB/YcsF family protein [Pseudomonas triclosanedens]